MLSNVTIISCSHLPILYDSPSSACLTLQALSLDCWPSGCWLVLIGSSWKIPPTTVIFTMLSHESIRFSNPRPVRIRTAFLRGSEQCKLFDNCHSHAPLLVGSRINRDASQTELAHLLHRLTKSCGCVTIVSIAADYNALLEQLYIFPVGPCRVREEFKLLPSNPHQNAHRMRRGLSLPIRARFASNGKYWPPHRGFLGMVASSLWQLQAPERPKSPVLGGLMRLKTWSTVHGLVTGLPPDLRTSGLAIDMPP